MLYVAGPGVCGFGAADVVSRLPPALLRGAVGSSGGALALALAVVGRAAALLAALDGAHEGALLQLMALRGSAARRRALGVWLEAAVGLGADVTFGRWPDALDFGVLALLCDGASVRPVLFSKRATPQARVADALTAALAWPAFSDAWPVAVAAGALPRLHCDAEYALHPHALAAGLRPPPWLVVQGACLSLAPACAAHPALGLLCELGEFHARVAERRAPTPLSGVGRGVSGAPEGGRADLGSEQQQ
jgi:hypothetical protein